MRHIFVFLLLLLTIIAAVLTNALGNVALVLAVAVNFPVFDESRFRAMVALGVCVSVVLQPWQWIYLIYLYCARWLHSGDHVFGLRSWWVLINFGRLLVMFSKVSVLNFLIGLFQVDWLVAFTLIFRSICSYFRLIVVFMGTEDDYEFIWAGMVPTSVFIDLILWGYLLLLRIYSQASRLKFSGTEITNIFEEYPIIGWGEGMLKILRVWHWVAYTIISLFILGSRPSLFTLLRIIPLVLTFTAGIVTSQRSALCLGLWRWNFYTAFAIAFVKYFYLLSQYSNLSGWLIGLLEPLV